MKLSAPTSASIVNQKPDGSEIPLTLGDLIEIEDGHYYHLLTLDMPCRWAWGCESKGSPQVGGERSLMVLQSEV
jgi:hypothetical protein